MPWSTTCFFSEGMISGLVIRASRSSRIMNTMLGLEGEKSSVLAILAKAVATASRRGMPNIFAKGLLKSSDILA